MAGRIEVEGQLPPLNEFIRFADGTRLMTIRRWMMITAFIALALGLLNLNAGVGYFTLSLIPLIGVALNRKTQSRWLWRTCLLISLTLLYCFSVGPYVATVRFFLAFEDHPVWLSRMNDTVYFPHYFMSSKTPQLGALLTRYCIEWSEVGIEFRDFVFRTSTRYPEWWPDS